MTDVGKDIIKLLIYSDIFKYPLKPPELYSRLTHNGIGRDAFEKELIKLVNERYIRKIGEFYLLENKIELIKRRTEANKQAGLLMKKALKNAQLISRFPFVRAVFLSGSISKGYIDDKSDIDYFIVTKPGKLWIARTLLILYKKIFLLNSYKYFCLNYFIDQDHYEIEDKNLFTANELITLIPAYNGQELLRILDANQWIKEYFPHFSLKLLKNQSGYSPGKLKLLAEKLLNNKAGSMLDDMFMRMTVKAINHKLNKLRQTSQQIRNINVRFAKHISKYHRNSFREHILTTYSSRVSEYENKFNLSLG
jgi:hypothetical protein